MARKKEEAGVSGQLREAMRGCGLSLAQLARETGVDKAQLSRFLRGERSLRLEAADKLCARLGLRLAGPALEEKE